MRKLIVLVAVSLSSSTANAQPNQYFVGGEVGYAMPPLAEVISPLTYGAALGMEWKNRKSSLFRTQLEVHYMHTSGKRIVDEVVDIAVDEAPFSHVLETTNTEYFTIEVGPKWYPAESIKGWHLDLLFGTCFTTSMGTKYNEEYGGAGYRLGYERIDQPRYNIYAVMTPGLGYLAGRRVDLSLRYRMLVGQPQYSNGERIYEEDVVVSGFLQFRVGIILRSGVETVENK